jgi:hypothetical protein
MDDHKVPFGILLRVVATTAIVTGWPVDARAQDAAAAQIGAFRPGVDALETTLRTKTALAVDEVPRKLAVKKLAETHGIAIKLNEEALAEAGVKLDAPVTASFRNFTLRAALFHVLGNDDLHFALGVKELIVGIGPPAALEVAQPAQLLRLWPQHAAQLGFEITVVPTDLGPAAFARINGDWIQCIPEPDADAAEAVPAKRGAHPREMQISNDPATVRHVAYWRDRSANLAEERLARLLDQRIEVVDRICRLSAVQREKLHLAGRGDIKRLLDRAAAVATRLENHGTVRDAEEFVRWARALYDEAEALRLDLETGSFSTKSLFAKALKRTLTPEQSAAYTAGTFAEK